MVPFLWRCGAKREPGRAKHQEPGWFVQLPIIGGLNQPPRLRPLRRLRGIFLMGAATPPCPRLVQGGDFGFPFSCFQCPRVQQKMWDMASLGQEGKSALPNYSVRLNRSFAAVIATAAKMMRYVRSNEMATKPVFFRSRLLSACTM